MDVCHVDEAGFAPTLPGSYSWYPVGERLRIPYEAPQGRRLNAIGGLFSHGPQAGRLEYELYAKVPKDRNRKNTTKKALASPEELARKHALQPSDIGTIDGECFVRFLWRLAGRPQQAPGGWVRERPLIVVLDNYSVHTSELLRQAKPALEAADVYLFHLPAYSPELSEIEPVWQDTKHHRLVRRSYELLGELKLALLAALQDKAVQLLERKQTYRLSVGST